MLRLLLTIAVCYYGPQSAQAEEWRNRNSSVSRISEMLAKSINYSVDPCDDFFDYACGNWIANHPIPKFMSKYSISDLLFDNVQEQMREVLESEKRFRSKSMEAIRKIYRKCMDEDELNRIGSREMLKSVKSVGTWPMLEGDEKWNADKFDLTSLLARLSYRVDVFFEYSIEVDSKNSSRYLIKFDDGNLHMAREYYLDKNKYRKKIDAYQNMLIKEITLFQKDGGFRTNRTKIKNDVAEIVDFEARIAKILSPPEEQRSTAERYNLRHLSDVQAAVPLVNWTQFFIAISPNVSHAYIRSDPEVVIADMDLLRRVRKLLQSTELRIVANYVYMQYALTWISEMGRYSEEIYQEFNIVLTGKQHLEPRWKYCTAHAPEGLTYAESAIYVRNVFDKDAKYTTLKLIHSLQKIFREMLLSSDWLNHQSKLLAVDKLKKMVRNSAYPDIVLSDEKLDDYYKGLDIDAASTYSEMLEIAMKWTVDDGFKRLLKPPDRCEFDSSVLRVNAYYSANLNSISILAAILQAPFYERAFPGALNYGGIGAVIGHELTHGFDDQGRQYDSIGNVRDWWDENAKKKFKEHAQCVINQYSNIKIPGMDLSVNGKLTQGENIADNGGVKVAYKAYKEYLKEHQEEEHISGLEEFSNEQLFFLAYAFTWCGDMREDALIEQVLTDEHPPERYRVNVVLANQPEFATAFKCDHGSAMNPSKRCAVW
ncbi:unnamed protein product [Cylicocyclus nassatus]|uniref:Uncharacterized protein n=1 Tax=Cylicocyclus nassatus TaxID=53992 RepID=A0AA36MED4_CYLNA|nr:unnamed protein product [Cylicocyclus nassatus]